MASTEINNRLKSDNKKITRPYKIATIILLAIPIVLFSIARRSGTVIDAETGEPIEGAIVLVEWTITKGIGLTNTQSYKVIEAVSDQNGKFTIMGSLNPFINEPHITIYKRNYVAWNNRLVFPKFEKREGFKWENGYVFQLEPFKNGYSYIEHSNFINSAALTSLASEKKLLLTNAFDEWELEKELQERKEKRIERNRK